MLSLSTLDRFQCWNLTQVDTIQLSHNHSHILLELQAETFGTTASGGIASFYCHISKGGSSYVSTVTVLAQTL